MVFLVFILIIVKISGRFASQVSTFSLYECGSEQQLGRLSTAEKVNFFKVMFLFLVFEVELFVLIPVLSLFSVVNFMGLFSIIAFIFLVQFGVIYEWRLSLSSQLFYH